VTSARIPDVPNAAFQSPASDGIDDPAGGHAHFREVFLPRSRSQAGSWYADILSTETIATAYR